MPTMKELKPIIDGAACPTCGAEKGEYCSAENGARPFYSAVHAKRRNLVKGKPVRKKKATVKKAVKKVDIKKAVKKVDIKKAVKTTNATLSVTTVSAIDGIAWEQGDYGPAGTLQVKGSFDMEFDNVSDDFFKDKDLTGLCNLITEALHSPLSPDDLKEYLKIESVRFNYYY